MAIDIDQKAELTLKGLSFNPQISLFIQPQLPIPKVFCGTGKIRVIILGQDPTVKNEKSRAAITTVLNLDKPGSLRNYVCRICQSLDIELEKNVYATNYLKNFFKDSPTRISEIDVFKEFAPYWLPLLREELLQFPQAPIISLGQPLLSAIVHERASPCVRDYWGYAPNWKSGERGTYRLLEPDKNVLGRVVFPFPHQPSIGKRFYAERFDDYAAFMRQQMGTGHKGVQVLTLLT